MQTETANISSNTNGYATPILNEEKPLIFQDIFDWSSTYEANDASR